MLVALGVAHARGAVAIEPDPQILLPGLRWTVDISAAPAIPPLLANGYVFLPLKTGIVAARRASDGEEVWRAPLVADQELASAADVVFVPAGEAIHALSASDGRELWLAPTGTITAPLLAKSGWLVAASGRTLYAFRAADGIEVWKREAGEVRERPTIDGDALFVSFSDGLVAALDLTTGKTRWEHKLAAAARQPLAFSDRVYVGSDDKSFYALRIDTGEVDWQWRVGAALLGRAAADGEHVYFTAMDNLLRALDRTSGNQRWRQELPFRPVAGPILVGETVVVPGATADLRLFATRGGRPLKAMKLDAPLAVPPGFGTEPGETLTSVAAITGGLTERWKLWLFGPLAPAPEGPPIEPLNALPGHPAQPGT